MKKCNGCYKELGKEVKPAGKWSFRGRNHFLYFCSKECYQDYHARRREAAHIENQNNPFNKKF